MRIKFVVPLLIIFLKIQLIAQELPIYQQYLLNPNLINPAITGSKGCTYLQVTDRHQWIGISDAPVSQIISIQKGFANDADKIHGMGLNLYRDANGASQQIGGDLIYAYHFLISRKQDIKISLGLSVSVLRKSINETDFTQVYDPIIGGITNSEILPEAGAGILVHNENFFAGLSALKMLSLTENLQPAERHFYLHSGLTFENERATVLYKPSALLKITESLNKQIDINFNTIFSDKWWFTLSYRSDLSSSRWQSMSVISVFGIDPGSFSFAYAFDLGLSNIQLYNFGSHEFMIRYKICPSGLKNPDCPTYKGLDKRYKTRR